MLFYLIQVIIGASLRDSFYVVDTMNKFNIHIVEYLNRNINNTRGNYYYLLGNIKMEFDKLIDDFYQSSDINDSVLKKFNEIYAKMRHINKKLKNVGITYNHLNDIKSYFYRRIDIEEIIGIRLGEYSDDPSKLGSLYLLKYDLEKDKNKLIFIRKHYLGDLIGIIISNF